jgi:hypothetical protein
VLQPAKASWTVSKGATLITKICLKRPCCLYFGQGSFKIESKELIHYVKEAEKEAFKTVE